MAKDKSCEDNAACLRNVPALKKNLVPRDRLDETVRYMRLLSHPTRIQILRLLSEKELCVCVIEKALGKTQPNISQHLSKLKDSRIIESRQKGKYIYYRIKDKNILKIINSIKEYPDLRLEHQRKQTRRNRSRRRPASTPHSPP